MSDETKSDLERALEYATDLEVAVMEIANGRRKPGRIPMEPIVRLIAYVRTGKVSPASISAKED